MGQYKLCIFANLIAPTPALREKIAALREAGVSCIFLYAAGVVRDERLDFDAIRDLCGIAVEAYKGLSQYIAYADDPLAGIAPTDRGILQTSRTAATFPCLRAGVHLYHTDGLPIYANSRMLAVFAHRPGTYTLCLPEGITSCTELYTEIRYETADGRLTLDFAADECKCFRLKDHITSLMTAGYLLDLNEVELLNLNQPYYDQNSRSNLLLGGKLFAVTGDLLTMVNDATRITLFNKNLFRDLNLEQALGSQGRPQRMPKYDETQDRYYSPVSAYGCNCITIPITASNVDRSAAIIEVLSCESMYTVTPAYIDVALEGRMLRDEELADMLDIILGTTIFEIGYMWNRGKVCTTIQTAATSNNPNLASGFTALVKVAEAEIKTTMESIEP